MMMSDREGIVSSVIYGPDQRTQIQASTQNVMFTVYAPSGIGEEVVRAHLQDIAEYVRLVAPDARAEMLEVFGNRTKISDCDIILATCRTGTGEVTEVEYDGVIESF